MGEKGHVATFNSTKHAETVKEMAAKREAVHDKGEEVLRTTGRMDPLVSVKNNAKRNSKFAFVRNPDGTFTLVNGPKRPYIFGTDGTGSFGRHIATAFMAAPQIYAMLERNARGDHHMDFAFAVAQDRGDNSDVVQFPQFESSELFAGHMRLLIPDKAGADIPEDYDLLIWYAANQVNADYFRYGGKGIFTLLLDAPGRGIIQPDLIKTHLGVDVQGAQKTKDVWAQLLTKFHGFIVIYDPEDGAVRFWEDVAGRNRVVMAPNPSLFDEVQAGLVYVTDNLQPTKEGLAEFLRAGGQNVNVSPYDIEKIWMAYLHAGVPFGANALMNIELPKPGDIFKNLTDWWPIGHPRAGENPAPGSVNADEVPATPAAPKPSPKPINWGKF